MPPLTYHNASTNAILNPSSSTATYSFNSSNVTTTTTATAVALGHWETKFTYTFDNFFHPFVG